MQKQQLGIIGLALVIILTATGIGVLTATNQQHSAITTMPVILYLSDEDAAISSSCAKVVGVTRHLPNNIDAKAVVAELIKLVPNETEEGNGLTNSYLQAAEGKLLEDLKVASVEVANDKAVVAFETSQKLPVGGSCRVTQLLSQLEATVKRFAGVAELEVQPEAVFQP